jgi:hypothetical protein
MVNPIMSGIIDLILITTTAFFGVLTIYLGGAVEDRLVERKYWRFYSNVKPKLYPRVIQIASAFIIFVTLLHMSLLRIAEGRM